MERTNMFENNEMHTEMTINHHWVPMAVFERLIEGHPNGIYKGITETTVVFKVENKDETELSTFTENWFLHHNACYLWYKQTDTEPSVKTGEEE
jgi:hypothetical protein